MAEPEWTTEITPRRAWFDVDLRALWRYRDLVMLFVRRDFVAVYKQTILGPFWYLLQPIASTVIFTIVFGRILGVSTAGVPKALFFLSGIVVWNYFAACFTKTADTLVANANLFGKVYFPRLVVPLASVLGGLISFVIQLSLFIAVALYYGSAVQPNLAVLLLPLLTLQMAALGLGVGILVSSLTTKYRDLTFLTGFAVQLWMYATPIVYPLSLVPEGWRWFYLLNPMTAVVESFRYAFLGGGALDPWRLAISVVETLAVLVLAIGLFSRVEKTFVDTV